MIRTLFLAISFLLFVGRTDAQNLNWVKTMGNWNHDWGRGIAKDKNGNIIVVGDFNWSVDFDPGPGSFSLTAGYQFDAFIAKYDSLGNFIWAKSIGGFFSEDGLCVSTDSSNNIIIGGFFSGLVDFDPGPSTYTLVSQATDGFICKLDAGGNFIWARGILSTNSFNRVNSVAIDKFGNILATGQFRGTVDFDPGPLTYTLNASGLGDVFIYKLDAAGNFIFAQQLGGTGNDVGYRIKADTIGNIYTIGTVSSSVVDYDPGPGIYTIASNGGADVFFTKFSPGGNFIWAKQIGGTLDEEGSCLDIDGLGNVLIAGAFKSASMDFDPGPGVASMSATGAYDFFLCKYDSSGIYNWSKRIGGTDNTVPNSIVADLAGNIYCTGNFMGIGTDFDPGPGTYTLTSLVTAFGFVNKFDPMGNFVWVDVFAGMNGSIGMDLVLGKAGNIYLTGVFYENTDFDPGPVTYTLQSVGATDIFIAKLSNCALPVPPNNITASSNRTVCAGKSATLAVNAITPKWYATSTSTSPIASGSAIVTPTLSPGQYTYFAEDSAYCGRSILRTPIQVTVYPVPNMVFYSTTSTVCAGVVFNQTVTGASSYTWSSGSNTTTAAYSFPTSTTVPYFVTGTSAFGCTNTISNTLTVVPGPSLSVIGNSAVCIGSSISQTATGAQTFTWNSGSNNPVITVSPTVTTVYSFSGTSSQGCKSAMLNTIVVNTLPTVNISGNSLACNGSISTQTASGATTYSWSNGLFGSVASLTPVTNSSYTVFGIDVNGCTNFATKTLSVLALPQLTISGNNTVCAGAEISQTVSGATTYTWNSGSNGNITTFTPSPVLIYTVSGTDLNGCTNFVTNTLNAVPLPVLTIAGNTSVCIGTPVSQTVTGASTYTWNSGSNGSVNTFTPMSNLIYTVSGTDANACIGTKVNTLIALALPTVSIAGNTVLCLGDTITLTATGAQNYSWTPSSFSPALVLTPNVSTTIAVVATDSNNCGGSANATVIVNALPNLLVMGDSAVCIGDSVTLTASGAQSYTWNNGSNLSTSVFTPVVNSSYAVFGTDLNNCTNTIQKTVTVNPLPSILIVGQTTVCNGAALSQTANGALSYTWSTGNNSATVSILTPVTNTFQVTGEDVNGCINQITETVSVVPLPTLTIVGADSVCKGLGLTLVVSGAKTFTWNGIVNSNSMNIVPTVNTTYTVTGTDSTGCINFSQHSVSVLPLPSINIQSSNSLICGPPSLETVTLIATGANSYTWNTGDTISAVVISPIATTNYTLVGKDLNGCINSSAFTLSVSPCLLNEIRFRNLNQVNVFPNPGDGQFHIQTQENYEARLINSLGEEMMSFKVGPDRETFNIYELPNGIYTLFLHRDGEKIATKIIKQ